MEEGQGKAGCNPSTNLFCFLFCHLGRLRKRVKVKLVASSTNLFVPPSVLESCLVLFSVLSSLQPAEEGQGEAGCNPSTNLFVPLSVLESWQPAEEGQNKAGCNSSVNLFCAFCFGILAACGRGSKYGWLQSISQPLLSPFCYGILAACGRGSRVRLGATIHQPTSSVPFLLWFRYLGSLRKRVKVRLGATIHQPTSFV